MYNIYVYIGSKTLVLSGGVSFEDDNNKFNKNDIGNEINECSIDINGVDADHKDERNTNYKGLCLIDLQMNDEAILCGSLRTLRLTPPYYQKQNIQNFVENKIKNENENENIFPCRDCRTHHKVFYNKKDKMLSLIGGGSLCMGFGAHYCTSVDLAVISGFNKYPDLEISGIYKNPDSQISAFTDLSEIVSDTKMENLRIDNENTNVEKEKEASVVLLVPSNRVKKVKMFLENHKPIWLDKKGRITVSEISDTNIMR
jgi:hypothetical protein